MVWDAGAQQGMLGESGPERVQRWRTEGTLERPAAPKIVFDDGENQLVILLLGRYTFFFRFS